MVILIDSLIVGGVRFVLDKVVEKEQLSVNEQELTEHIIRSASRYGMGPDKFAQEIVQALDEWDRLAQALAVGA